MNHYDAGSRKYLLPMLQREREGAVTRAGTDKVWDSLVGIETTEKMQKACFPPVVSPPHNL